MKFDSNKHHRRSVRLKDYDYSSVGAYYITVCTRDRQCLFGEIIENKIHLNKYGKIAKKEWMKTPMVRPNIKLDEFVIMPNHIHGIITISNNPTTTCSRGVLQYAPTNTFCSPSQTIGSIIRGFKSTITRQINILCDTPDRPIWQRSFYDHVIRNEISLHKIREYIVDNPLTWQSDIENTR